MNNNWNAAGFVPVYYAQGYNQAPPQGASFSTLTSLSRAAAQQQTNPGQVVYGGFNPAMLDDSPAAQPKVVYGGYNPAMLDNPYQQHLASPVQAVQPVRFVQPVQPVQPVQQVQPRANRVVFGGINPDFRGRRQVHRSAAPQAQAQPVQPKHPAVTKPPADGNAKANANANRPRLINVNNNGDANIPSARRAFHERQRIAAEAQHGIFDRLYPNFGSNDPWAQTTDNFKTSYTIGPCGKCMKSDVDNNSPMLNGLHVCQACANTAR